jgi:fucose 4-O-acetylase-like acetyltransferase
MVETAPPSPSRRRARDLAAATPETRNRYADLLRVASIFVVVIGHWLMAVLEYEDGSFVGKNLLEIATWTHILTWIFQVMPIFFIVGGFTNAGSWRSASRRGVSYATWLRARSARLLGPALVFVAFWTVLPMLAVLVGLPSGMARTGGREVALPIWFLAVYLLTVAAAPPLLAAHQRYGVRVLVALAVGAATVDAVRYGLDVGWIGVLNYAFVWLAILELGFLWREGALTRVRWVPRAIAGAGLAALALLTTVFDYPVSMIGLSHAQRSNTLPPTIALLALAVWQCGAMLIFEKPANRWLLRPPLWLGVVVANSMVMTFYLWNMTAAVLAAVILLPTGIAPQFEELSGAWWLWRARLDRGVRDLPRAVPVRVPVGRTARRAATSGAGGMERPRDVPHRRSLRLRRDVDHRRGSVPRAGRGAGDSAARSGVPGRRSDPAAREPVQPSLEALCRDPPRLTL